ncbi:MAG: protein-L-isoaspartate(D-aspartate) O-methyltransferase [Armatimonadota bacterium]
MRARVNPLLPSIPARRSGHIRRAVLVAVAAFTLVSSAYARAPDYRSERADMVARLRKQKITNERVLQAMGRVPRHSFVSDTVRSRAYSDAELPIGRGQVMCSPYVTALMAQVLDPRPGSKILEVGTGSGYLSAVLAEITPNVYSVDVHTDLVHAAQARLRSLHYSRVRFRSGAACQGWQQNGPFDGIVVNCAAEVAPEPLIAQLRDGGRLVIPIGHGPEQTLNCMRKSGGRLRAETIMSIRVTPMTCRIRR